MSTSDELKSVGNEYFTKGEFKKAEEFFTQAIEQFGPTAILLTNRAASRIPQEKYDDAIVDAEEAMKLDPKWTKAYYRKANALEKQGKFKEAYEIWVQASMNCDKSTLITSHMDEAKKKWISLFRTVPVSSMDDFLSRFGLLENAREKLSTLAHFWNNSDKSERLSVLVRFMEIIGGSGSTPEMYSAISDDMMLDLPMNNYEDLPSKLIPSWMTFFNALSSNQKVVAMEAMWTKLTPAEQSAVITDMKVFIFSKVEPNPEEIEA